MKTELSVTGMTCGNCVKHVTEALRTLPGVTQVDVALHEGRATIEHDGRASSDSMIAAVQEEGYQAALVTAGR